ncbi:PLP-dependent aminotransferase family protein [Inediibacterium massiliense]|uniref:aminotransferase-like domain-containing protein n=1 Tax=Inediibacterium massiliense TaxID=1658111 RepID=UPI0006B57B78|nr:PLP-dependent aminotransferase family protein [Inediibacterium massiliense]
MDIDWKPHRKDTQPLYMQIVDYVKGKIREGEWVIGMVLPSQRELADLFEVNRSTIVAAMDELKAEGIIEGRGKGGTKIIRDGLPSIIQPNWQAYIEEGIYIPNFKTIKQINELEFENNMIRLSTGEASPSLFPTNKMSIILNEVAKGMKNLGYEEPKGMYYLREQISKYLKTYGICVSPSCILIVSGALQAIQLIAMGILQPGSSVFLEKPSYLYSLQILQSVGMKRFGIPMDEEGIKASLIPKYIRKHKSSILYTIPNFQNPTGIVMSQRRRKQLMEVCQKEKIPIIEDDVYRELWIDEKPPIPLKSLDTHGLVLYVGSVSKTLSPGLRIGWIVGPEPVIDHLADMKMQSDYGSSSLAQFTVGKWLETGLYKEHLLFLRKELAIRRDIALEILKKHFYSLATWEIPKGGYYVWLRLKDPINMYKLFDESCKIGILLYPGYIYDVEQNPYLRISYSYASIEELKTGLVKLSQLIHRMKSNHI